MILVIVNDSLRMAKNHLSVKKDNYKLIDLALKINEIYGKKSFIKILTTIPGFNKYNHTAFRLSEILGINKIIYIGKNVTEEDDEMEEYFIYDLEKIIKDEVCDVLILVSHYGNVEQLIEKFYYKLPINPDSYVEKAEAMMMNLETRKLIYI